MGNTNTYQSSITRCRTMQQTNEVLNIFVQVQNSIVVRTFVSRGSNYKYLSGILYCSQFGGMSSPMQYNEIKCEAIAYSSLDQSF